MSPRELLNLALQIAAQEEAQQTPTTLQSTAEGYSYIRIYNNPTIPFEFEDIGTGTLEELTIISPSNDFIVEIYSSNKQILRNTYEELASYSSFISWIGTTEYASNYVISISNIKYDKSLRIIVTSTSIRSMTKIVLKITKKNI